MKKIFAQNTLDAYHRDATNVHTTQKNIQKAGRIVVAKNGAKERSDANMTMTNHTYYTNQYLQECGVFGKKNARSVDDQNGKEEINEHS